MRSVTIKDLNGTKLIKVFQRDDGYWCETLDSVGDLDVVIRTDDNTLVKIPIRVANRAADKANNTVVLKRRKG